MLNLTDKQKQFYKGLLIYITSFILIMNIDRVLHIPAVYSTILTINRKGISRIYDAAFIYLLILLPFSRVRNFVWKYSFGLPPRVYRKMKTFIKDKLNERNKTKSNNNKITKPDVKRTIHDDNNYTLTINR